MRKQGLAGLLGVLAGVGLMAGNAAAFSATYDQKMTQGRKVYESKVSMKNELFRMEMTAEGQAMIILHNAQGTFTVMPSEGMAMKTDNLRSGQRPVSGADNYAAFLQRHNAEKTGSETIDGRACDIYRYTDPQDGLTTVWVWKEKMFPIKIQTASAIVEMSNIQLAAAIPDEAFQLPAGIQVMDMGNLMGVLQ